MLQHEHFSHGLLYSLSPEHLVKMHIGDNADANNPSGPPSTDVHSSVAEHLLGFLRKILKHSI